jgi:hypothetical protein
MVILVAVILLLGIAYFIWKTKFKNNEALPLPIVNIEILSEKSIVDWFREEKNMSRLKSDANLIAVSLKGGLEIGKLDIPTGSYLVCLFNEASNEVIDGLIFKPNNISDDVVTMFKDKDMITLS